MASAYLKPGDIVVDYSWVRPDPHLLAANGVKAVSRYIAGGTNNGKVLTIAERDALWAAGLGILLNWEQDAGGPLGGAIVGAEHGKKARELALALGYPETLAICVSVDVDTNRYNVDQVVEYFRAFQAASRWMLTAYCDRESAEALFAADLIVGVWAPSAVGWGRPTGNVYLDQHYGIRYEQLAYLGDQIDHNTVRNAFPAWTGAGDDVHDAAELPKEDDLMWTVFDLADADASFLVLLDAHGIGGVGKWLATPAKRQAHLEAGAPLQQRTVAELANVTLVGPLPAGDSRHEWTGEEFD